MGGLWRNRDIKQLVPSLDTIIIRHNNFLSSVSHAENGFYPLADIRVCETRLLVWSMESECGEYKVARYLELAIYDDDVVGYLSIDAINSFQQ